MWDLIVSVPDHCLSFYLAFPLSIQEYSRLGRRGGMEQYFGHGIDGKLWLM